MSQLGNYITERKERASEHRGIDFPVYGVDRSAGLTSIAKYQSKDLSRYKLIRPGMFAYNPMRLNIGSIAYCEENQPTGLVSPDYVVFSCNKDALNHSFMKYFILGMEWQHWTHSAGVGSVRIRIYFKELAAMPFNPPTPSEQKSISHILSTIDNKVKLNRKMNVTLESMARALFKSWFIDFDPVIDKALEARNPIPEVLQAKAERRKSLKKQRSSLVEYDHSQFPSSFAYSEEMGWMPKGWAAIPSSNFASLNPETISKKSAPDTIEYVDLSNTNRGRIEATTRYNFEDAPSRARRVIRPHDTIIGTVRPGNRAYAYISAEGLTCSTGFAVMRPAQAYWRAFLYLHITSDDVIENLAHIADGGAYPAVRPDVVAEQLCIAPTSHGILEYFEVIIAPIVARIAASEAESSTLVHLRDALLPQLLSGNVGIRQLENEAAVGV